MTTRSEATQAASPLDRKVMPHTLLHGDCLDLMAQIPDRSVDMILCDLPYGTTACKWDTVIPFEPLWAHYKRVIKPNGAVVLFGSQPFTTELVNSNRKDFRYELIWAKNMPTGAFNANKMPMKSHENLCVFYASLPTYNPQKTKRTEKELKRFMKEPVTTIIENSVYGSFERTVLGRDAEMKHPHSLLLFDVVNGRNADKVAHPTQKPVALCEYMIRTYTNEGETVLDNCMGSGTTGIACMNTGRNFIGIEKDPKYFEIARNRIMGHNVKVRGCGDE